MQLDTVGSGSKGNCYLIHNDAECIILEAGIPLKVVKKALNFRMDTVKGVLVSHEHGDHAECVKEFQKLAIPVYASSGTAAHFQSQTGVRQISELVPVQIGNFTVIPFHVEHDASEPFGFHITHPDMGTLLFATDCSSIPYTFSDIDHFLIECNYLEDVILQNCNNHLLSVRLMERIQQSHMSITGCADFLKSSGGANAQNLILCHLSAGNSNVEAINEYFSTEFHKTPKIARKGLSVEIGKMPY